MSAEVKEWGDIPIEPADTTATELPIDECEDRATEPGSFPIDALTTTTRIISEEIAKTYLVDTALPAMAGIAVIGGAVGKSVAVIDATSGRRTPLNVFVTPAAPKSYGKNAAAIMVRPLLNASAEIANHFKIVEKPALLAEREVLELRKKMLVRRCAKKEATEEEQAELVGIQVRLPEIQALVACSPSYTISNTTSAGLVEMLKRNGQTIFSFSPEAGELVRIALGKFNKDQAADFDLFLSGYTVEVMRETRIGRGDTGEDFTPCISVLWFCQPLLLRELFANEEALERGLTARVLPFIVEHDQIPEDDGELRNVSAEAESGWNKLVRGALELRRHSHEIKCSSDAREIFRAFHNEAVALRNEQFRAIEGELGRWRENAIRIAGGLCVADALEKGKAIGSIIVTPEQAQRGVKIARWSHLYSITMLNRSLTERNWKRFETLQDLLRNRYGGAATLRDLQRRNGFSPNESRSLVGAFPHIFLIRTVKSATGRPSEVLTLVPR
jgi:hypothetical protein